MLEQRQHLPYNCIAVAAENVSLAVIIAHAIHIAGMLTFVEFGGGSHIVLHLSGCPTMARNHAYRRLEECSKR